VHRRIERVPPPRARAAPCRARRGLTRTPWGPPRRRARRASTTTALFARRVGRAVAAARADLRGPRREVDKRPLALAQRRARRAREQERALDVVDEQAVQVRGVELGQRPGLVLPHPRARRGRAAARARGTSRTTRSTSSARSMSPWWTQPANSCSSARTAGRRCGRRRARGRRAPRIAARPRAPGRARCP
jgi:hypothetical protein